MSIKCLPLSYYHMVPCLLASTLLQKIHRKICNSKKIWTQLSSLPEDAGKRGFLSSLCSKEWMQRFSQLPEYSVEFRNPGASQFLVLQTASWGCPESSPVPESRAHWWGWGLLQNSPSPKPFLPVTNTAATADTTEIRNSAPSSSHLQPCSSASPSQEGTGNGGTSSHLTAEYSEGAVTWKHPEQHTRWICASPATRHVWVSPCWP